MTESQSRYSIVDELISKKNSADNEIADLVNGVEKRKLQLKRATEDIEAYKKEVKRKIVTLNARKQNLDEAIKAIEGISNAEKK